MRRRDYAIISVVVIALVLAFVIYSIIPSFGGLAVTIISPEKACSLDGWDLYDYYCSGTDMYVTCIDDSGTKHYITLKYHQECGATACGDGSCGTSEDYLSCPEDCPPPEGEFCQSVHNCIDGNPCTWDYCSEGIQTCWNIFYSSSSDYEDGNLCTWDYCEEGASQITHEQKDCDDNNPCTIDSCDPDVGCINEPRDCPENYECDKSTGTCVYVDPCLNVTCDSYCEGFTLYHNGRCVEGVCQYETKVNAPECGYDECVGMSVDDSNPCTFDYCTNGEVKHEPMVCPDNTVCNPNTGKCEGEGVSVEPTEPFILDFNTILIIIAIIILVSLFIIWYVRFR